MVRVKKPLSHGTVVLKYEDMPEHIKEKVLKIIRARETRDMGTSTIAAGSAFVGKVLIHGGEPFLTLGGVITPIAASWGLGSWIVHHRTKELANSLKKKEKGRDNYIIRDLKGRRVAMVYVNKDGHLVATDGVPMAGGRSRIVITEGMLTKKQTRRLRRRGMITA